MLGPTSPAEPGKGWRSAFPTGSGSLLGVSCWALGLCLGAPAPEAAAPVLPQAPSCGAGAWLGWRSSGGAGSEGLCIQVLSRSHSWHCPSCRVTSVLQCPLAATPFPGLPPRHQSVTGSSLVPDPSPRRLWRFPSVPVGLRSHHLLGWNVTCGAGRAQVTVVLVMEQDLLFQLDATEFTRDHDVSFCLDSLGLGWRDSPVAVEPPSSQTTILPWIWRRTSLAERGKGTCWVTPCLVKDQIFSRAQLLTELAGQHDHLLVYFAVV